LVLARLSKNNFLSNLFWSIRMDLSRTFFFCCLNRFSLILPSYEVLLQASA
jgi:hypothetical protein